MRSSNKEIAFGAGGLAVLTFLGSAILGKHGDCAPHAIDGQCGMSTFMGVLFGSVAAVCIAIAAGVLIAVRMWQTGREGGLEEQ